MDFHNAKIYDGTYRNHTVKIGPNTRRFQRPSESQALTLITNEINSRPDDITETAWKNIAKLHHALIWEAAVDPRFKTNGFPYWDNDIEISKDDYNSDPKNTIHLTRKQIEIFYNNFPEGGRNLEDSYLMTPKGQWRAINTPKEAERLLEIRDVIKELEEKHVYLIHLAKQDKVMVHGRREINTRTYNSDSD